MGESFRLKNENFGFEILSQGKHALLASESWGLSIHGDPISKIERLEKKGLKTRYRVINSKSQEAQVVVEEKEKMIMISVELANGHSGEIALRSRGCGGPAYGLGDHGGWQSNANLGGAQKVYEMKQDGHKHRFVTSFVIFPRERVAGAFFQKKGGVVTLGAERYEMKNLAATSQTFYFFTGSIREIYDSYRTCRIKEGFPGVMPKMVGFELGWESWDLLKWRTAASSCQRAIEGFLDRGYRVRWVVTGSGFWQEKGSTTSFGKYDWKKYPDSRKPAPPDFGDWAKEHGIRWMIGQRTNFVKLGGPHSSKPGESGATLFDTSPDSSEGVSKGYFLRNPEDEPVTLKSSIFPTVPSYLLDGNVPGAAEWFRDKYGKWGVDGVKEDTMLAVPDHTIFNRPMRLIAEEGDFVMARCAAYSSPGTLLRVNDTHGASSMTLRCPINYLQYAFSGMPNVYSDTVGFSGMKNVETTVRHAWLLATTAGMAVSDSPWSRGWSKENELAFKKAFDFHYEIGPYLYSAAMASHRTGFPETMTPLPLAFPDDEETYNLASKERRQFQWMIGPSLMATPMLHGKYGPGATMDIYLPEGIWIDFETGMKYEGPRTLEGYEMPIDKVPVFVGGKGVFVSRKDDEAPLEAVVYPVMRGGPAYEFTFPDGKSTCSVINRNTGWKEESLKVMNDGEAQDFRVDEKTGALRFVIQQGARYEIIGGS